MLFTIIAAGGCGAPEETVDADWVYKIETGGVQAGYAVVDTSLVMVDGRPLVRMEQHSVFQSRLLGSDVDSETHLTYLLEPRGKRLVRHEGAATSQTQDVSWFVEIDDGRAVFYSTLAADTLTLDLPPDAVVENSLFFEQVVADLVAEDQIARTYRLLDLTDFKLQDVLYERRRREEIELDGSTYDALVVDRSITALGTLVRQWLCIETGLVLKVVEQDGNVITLARPEVTRRLERVDLDKYILDETNVAIADVTGIDYLKVRAKIRPMGLQPTVASLNVPGQTFAGTVEDGVIDGVFEIEHPRYDGTGAPVFPPDAADYAGQAAFLGADGIFEADDEVLVAEARSIAAGAIDCWQAAVRLARWVSDEIEYAIPGGGTARNTYDLRAGECGAHSILLATFCRAVGIPARMVWGCMYTPDRGGVFGQHGWTEVHMGPAGWIPLDATAGETDYLDSGHIRVAHFSSLISRLNGQEFEILDYRVAGGSAADQTLAEARYGALLGIYKHAEAPGTWEVKVMDGALVVRTADGAMLAFAEPDSAGRWMCKMAPYITVEFSRGPSEKVETFTLHESHSLPRRDMPEAIPLDVPSELASYLGSYSMVRLGADFEVRWQDGRFVLLHPHQERAFHLERAAGDEAWQTVNGPYKVVFATGEDGVVTGLELDVANEFKRE